jgi:uncharacterized repeat protein (TIGR03803 family)
MGKVTGRGVVVLWIFCVTTAITGYAQRFAAETLDFADGGNPAGDLVQGLDGYLYGTALYGGANSGCANIVGGCGTIFQLASTGKPSVFYSFCSQTNCTDGDTPAAGVILGADGDFYGTTLGGGAHGVQYPKSGTVFRITSGGKLTTLHSFCSQVSLDGVCTDGASPLGGLLQASDGNFYGITYAGGNGDVNNRLCYDPDVALYGCGTIFRMTASGKLTTLYSFCPQLNQGGFCPDGQSPSMKLVEGSDGSLYGTTLSGGTNSCDGFGCGTIFKITPSGKFTTIYSFCPDQSSCVDGDGPARLLRAANGNFYGTTEGGGPLGGGSVFQITPTGTLTTLYGFCNPSTGACPDGYEPLALIQANDGNIYGTTEAGGASCFINGSHGCGTIYRLTPGGIITTLHTFCQNQCYDGADALALAQDTNGILFGVAGNGGADQGCDLGCGTVYGLAAGLKPVPEASPNFGKVGQVVSILGNKLIETSSVTFNGATAKFEVVSGTYIKAQVPTGATTGTIEVTTPDGAINSYPAFHVLQ